MTRISYSLIMMFFVVLVPGTADEIQTFTVSSVAEKSVIVERTEGDGSGTRLRLLEIYNVYEREIEVEGKRLLVNFCGTVYLEKMTDANMEFALTWEEEGNYLKAGYILASTGRFFPEERERLVKIIDDEDQGRKPASSTAAIDTPVFRMIVFGGAYLDLQFASSVTATFGARAELLAILADRLGVTIQFDSGAAFDSINAEIGINLYAPIRLPSSVFLFYAGIGFGVFSTSMQSTSMGEMAFVSGESGLIFNLPFIDPDFGKNIFAGAYAYTYLYLSGTGAFYRTSIGIKFGYRFL